jgi:hypothetical protein
MWKRSEQGLTPIGEHSAQQSRDHAWRRFRGQKQETAIAIGFHRWKPRTDAVWFAAADAS